MSVLVSLAVPALGWAEPVDLTAGRRAYEEGDFDRALAAIVRALDAPDASVGDLAESHRHLAVLRLVLGDRAGAQRHADAALALAPDLGPPAGAPPDAAALFREAARARRPLSLTATLVDTGPDTALQVASGPAPEALALRLQARCDDGSGSPRLRVTTPNGAGAFPLPSSTRGERLSCDVALVTSSGASVRAARVTRDARPRGRSALPWVLGVTGVVVTAAAVGLLVWAVSPPEGPRIEGPRWPGP